ncbi:uncharacterized protein BP5553_07523 [Venustampulla echinocandica]|uniref:Uncharacterized protein n=1 Tax=Venustampulla echinocandica TaxID=2656787 RepID=A0A370TGS2_9HELO|nr:uncharacterized protein BP5553_07523 [Venustampulla echinocandica]RDL34395.1 hypothetical protein BP5553_07523 [Venustampulla echinocandica]
MATQPDIIALLFIFSFLSTALLIAVGLFLVRRMARRSCEAKTRADTVTNTDATVAASAI